LRGASALNGLMSLLSLIGYIGPTVLLVVYSQIVLKWRVAALGAFPSGSWERAIFLLRALIDPYIASGVIAAFIGSLLWLAAISRIPLSVGFPVYYGVTFALVILGSAWLLNEPMTSFKIVGAVLILLGVIVGSMD
jgi:drug/metabolite transporter (DMT)-like permease